MNESQANEQRIRKGNRLDAVHKITRFFFLECYAKYAATHSNNSAQIALQFIAAMAGISILIQQPRRRVNLV